MNRRLWHLIKPHSTLLAAAIVLLLLLSLLELAGPYLTQQAIDRYIAPKRLDGYQWLAILWFLVLITNGLARYGQLQLTNRIGQRVMFDLRNAIFAHWQRMGVAFFDRTAVGELVSLISNDAPTQFGKSLGAGMADFERRAMGKHRTKRGQLFFSVCVLRTNSTNPVR